MLFCTRIIFVGALAPFCLLSLSRLWESMFFPLRKKEDTKAKTYHKGIKNKSEKRVKNMWQGIVCVLV